MPTQAEIIQARRFEYGIRPGENRFKGGLMAQLDGDDPLGREVPITRTDARMARLGELRELSRARGLDSDEFKQARQALRQAASADMMRILARAVQNPRGFRERLFAFWLDHFTVTPKQARESYMLPAYFEDAIRPYVSGRFADMLKAVVTHPSMLIYLDQNTSTGPNSRAGQRRNAGLNENLAREILELHTLGVSGPYTQDDVRQFAELLTGLTIGPEGVRYARNRAEPGAEEILGNSYGGGPERLENIFAFLEDLAMNPATARHLAQKLVVHFIGPEPRPELVSNMALAYLDSGGEMQALYRVLVNDPAAKAAYFPKVRPPFEYIATVLRALSISGQDILSADRRTVGKLGRDLAAMGQRPFQPGGPDGWPEAAEKWINPPQLAARISWAGQLAQAYADDRDPRALLDALLGNSAPDNLTFAVSGAQTKWEGVALLLVSPSLMRR